MTLLGAILLTLFLMKHYIADMPLQTGWMAFNKGSFLHPGGLAHAGIHMLCSLVMVGPLWFWGWLEVTFAGVLGVIAAEGVVHYLIDFSKMNYDRHANCSRLNCLGRPVGRPLLFANSGKYG